MAARIEPGARSALRRLARFAHLHPDRLSLVVLSGRAAPDVARRVRVGGIRYLGNHGLESGLLRRGDPAERLRVEPDPTLSLDEAGAFAVKVSAFGAAVHDHLGRPAWLFVEEKGPSVAFHFRQAADPGAARVLVLSALDELQRDGRIEPDNGPEGRARDGRTGEGVPVPRLERLEGRQVVELRPAGAGGKGAAMARLIEAEQPAAILSLGDDVSDAEAFRAVIDAREAIPAPGGIRPDGLVIAVHGLAETPAEILASADLLVAAPRDAARALGELARVLLGDVPRAARGAREPAPRAPAARTRSSAPYRAAAATAPCRPGASRRDRGAGDAATSPGPAPAPRRGVA